MAREDSVLDNKTRRLIFNHIAAYPGVSYSTLRKVLDIPAGTLSYHLNYLIRHEGIRFELDKGKRVYYVTHEIVSDMGLRDGQVSDIKLSAVQEKLLTTIKHYPGITRKELIQITGLNRFTAINNLRRLLSLGLIRKYNEEGNVCYDFLTDEELKYEILRRLLIKLIKKEIDEETFLRLKRKLE
jgi:predicted transcriptional regulator